MVKSIKPRLFYTECYNSTLLKKKFRPRNLTYLKISVDKIFASLLLAPM